MNYILFDDQTWVDLLPLTFTRPIAEIRIGILTISEKWNKALNTSCSHITQDYLSVKYQLVAKEDNLLINGSILPNKPLVDEIHNLKLNEVLISENTIVAARVNQNDIKLIQENILHKLNVKPCTSLFDRIKKPWDIFSLNGKALSDDFDVLTKGRKSQPISKTNNVIKPENIFLEEGAIVEFATLNASTGSIYIGRNAEVMEGSLVRGGLALCEDSALKLGTKIYGPTTIGPHSKVGGEVNNCVIFGYSNKGHDGFLGNSVIGEWCNLGADTNNSNLKNNYADVKVWNYVKEGFISTNLMFCGLIMGDHSKCGINTMFNTGTVVGVSANIFGAGFPRNFIPSFSWGGTQGMSVYPLNKAFETAQKVMERRGIELNEIEKNILTRVFDLTQKYRNF